MNDTSDQVTGPVWLSVLFIVAGAAVLVVLIRWGLLRRDAMAGGPRRDVGLAWYDLPGGLAATFVGMAVAGAVAVRVFGVSVTDPGAGPAEQAASLLFTQTFATLVLIAYLAVRTMNRPEPWRRFGLLPRPLKLEVRDGGLGLIAGVLLTLAALNAMGWLGVWLGDPPPAVGHELLDEILDAEDALALLLLVVTVVLVGPFWEELVFRGLMQTSLLAALGIAWRWPIVLVTAAVFAAIHVGAGTLDANAVGGVPWHALPGLFVLGLVMGWLYERTGSLWPAVIVHGGFNAVNVVTVLLMQQWGWLD